MFYFNEFDNCHLKAAVFMLNGAVLPIGTEEYVLENRRCQRKSWFGGLHLQAGEFCNREITYTILIYLIHLERWAVELIEGCHLSVLFCLCLFKPDVADSGQKKEKKLTTLSNKLKYNTNKNSNSKPSLCSTQAFVLHSCINSGYFHHFGYFYVEWAGISWWLLMFFVL